MRAEITPPKKLEGAVLPPPDKSISHRAAILNAFASGQATVTNFSPGADCASTVRCLRALGVTIELDAKAPGTMVVNGLGPHGLHEPTRVLDAGNSGTTMRLLTGLLASQPFLSILTGDRSLRSRPMGRIVKPLTLMGAEILGRQGNTMAPLAIKGNSLRGIDYSLPVSSAQLKSALILAGLSAQGDTRLHQPAASRDHTERMIRAMGADLKEDGLFLTIRPSALRAVDVYVPGDISAAAFWLVAACCHPKARVRIEGIGINPYRTGILDALLSMGAKVAFSDRRDEGGEPVADLTVESSGLKATEICGEMIPRIIDEIPVLAVAACFAQGTTVIRDAQELRVKESDRIKTTLQELSKMGAKIEELPDGMIIQGTGFLKGASCRSHGDHRMAMTLGIAGLLAQGETTVEGAEATSVSYPSFWQDLENLCQR